MPANDGMTDRRYNAEFYQGSAIDGTFKSLAPDRGGFVEYDWPRARQDAMGWPYGLYEDNDAGDLMFDEPLRKSIDRPMK